MHNILKTKTSFVNVNDPFGINKQFIHKAKSFLKDTNYFTHMLNLISLFSNYNCRVLQKNCFSSFVPSIHGRMEPIFMSQHRMSLLILITTDTTIAALYYHLLTTENRSAEKKIKVYYRLVWTQRLHFLTGWWRLCYSCFRYNTLSHISRRSNCSCFADSHQGQSKLLFLLEQGKDFRINHNFFSKQKLICIIMVWQDSINVLLTNIHQTLSLSQ